MTTSMSVNDKAVSLRTFLFEKKRMETFGDALPKWLSVERLLRVVFSSALKNPRILDCTKESILNAVMGCATLGLEPILGRAHLIPYNNNKRMPNGKWKKVLECQFQPGYQGLVDLARRTGTISDVYGFNVYEADEFDITYGMNRNIHHKPWFMDPKKRGKNESGEIFGAYCVWVLKDGTIHPEFMYLSEIHKRRNKSQAYQNAMQYKKEDTPWIQWPEEMNLKTVVKHSSKLVPASIEFMEAVSYDNDAEIGASATFSSYFLPKTGTEEPQTSPPTNTEAFDAIIREQGLDKDRVDRFMEAVTKQYNTAMDEIIASTVEDLDGFLGEFRKWEAATYKKTPPTLKDKIGGLKTTGLTGWEKEHHDEIGGLPEEDKKFFLAKWQRTIKHDYYAEGQPGHKPEQREESVQQEALPHTVTKESTGEGDFEEVDRRRRLNLEFQRAMLQYRDDETEGIGQAKFHQVLRQAGFEDIQDVPEEDYASILQAMEAAR